jgi:hypothetical protein
MERLVNGPHETKIPVSPISKGAALGEWATATGPPTELRLMCDVANVGQQPSENSVITKFSLPHLPAPERYLMYAEL